jgi:hypothetical protein
MGGKAPHWSLIMSKTKDKIEGQYRIPCGPMDIAADAICRRSLRDRFDNLLDRLTVEVNPQQPAPGKLSKELEVSKDGEIVAKKEETEEDRRKKLIDEGKFRAEVHAEIKKYREDLQGNGKMLQDISGKYESI